ncbi:MAG: ABC transporter permease subunit, partial [Candidatus Thorarchaeota archaeon]
MSGLFTCIKTWVKQNQNSFRGWLGLEIGTSYRFPVVEGLITVPLYIILAIVIPGHLIFRGFNINSDNVNDDLYGTFAEIVEQIEVIPLLVLPQVLVPIIIFLVPMLVALTTARGFENGTTKTYLSYPLSRFQLLILKTGLGVLMTGILSTLTLIFARFIMGVLSIQLDVLLAIIIGVWTLIILVASVTTFFAVVSKNTIATGFLGIGTFYAALMTYIQSEIGPSLNLPDSIRGIMNPLFLVGDHLIDLYTEVPEISSISFADVL